MKLSTLMNVAVACAVFSTAVGAQQAVDTVAALPEAPWVADDAEYWKDATATFRLGEDGVAVSAEGWVAVTDEAIRLHIVVKDTQHVGSNAGSAMWRNDSIQFGIDALGDGTMGRPADAEVIGRGDADYCVSLTTSGPAAWSFTHSALSGTGARDIPLQIARDDTARTTTYDIGIPWSEFQLCPGVAPTMGLSVMVNDSNPDAQQQRLYWGKGVEGRFQPGLFKQLRVGRPSHDYADVSVLNRMLSEEHPAAEAVVVVSTERPIQVGMHFGGGEPSLTMAEQDGAFSRMVVRAEPDAKLRAPDELRVEVTSGDAVLASAATPVWPDYESDWWVFEPANDTGPSEIGMEEWLEAPAGVHGGVRIVGDEFRYEDGSPVKFWGLNIGSRTMFSAPKTREDMTRFAEFYRKYGVNCLRIHKHIENSGGLLSENSVLEFDPEKLDKYDFWTNELKKVGVYHGLSHVFRMGLKPGDADRVLAYEEIMKPRLDAEGNPQKDRNGNIRRTGNTVGFKTFARDVQQIHIDQTVKILNHRNPYTGLRYAEDPALAFVEMHNEDDIFFYTTFSVVQGAPTYKKLICEMFSDWLKARYGSHEKLVAAWGERAMNAFKQFHDAEEHLDKRNIYPMTHAWWLSPAGLASQEEQFGTRRRLLDTARFMYDTQVDFYTRYEKAIRDTGYQGPIVGSCWKSSSGVPHYYNLHTDYLVGHVDRHGYYGGGGRGGHSSFSGESLLNRPQGSILEAFNQVTDRPFALSEWIGVNPYPWSADGPPIIAAYGLGLQGWDASYEFASGQGAYSEDRGGRWNAMRPTQLGQFPTIARMVYRGDVKEAPVISNRKVHVPSLADGKLGFYEERALGQTADFNALNGDVPNEAIAAGRLVVEFTDAFERTDPFDMNRYMRNGVVRSVTNQLEWHTGTSMPTPPVGRTWDQQQGYVLIRTDGTAGVVGFAPPDTYDLGAVSIEPQGLFSVVLVTAGARDGNLREDDKLLVTAVARSKNTGQEYQPSMTMSATASGQGPVLMEPVRAVLRLKRPGTPTVHVLDHDGRRTGRTLPVTDGAVSIDTGRDTTLYYQIVY